MQGVIIFPLPLAENPVIILGYVSDPQEKWENQRSGFGIKSHLVGKGEQDMGLLGKSEEFFWRWMGP